MPLSYLGVRTVIIYNDLLNLYKDQKPLFKLCINNKRSTLIKAFIVP